MSMPLKSLSISLESFKNIARMQDEQTQDQCIRIKTDKKGRESCLEVGKTTTSVEENQAIRDRFVAALSSDRRFSNLKGQINGLLREEREGVDVYNTPLTARKITTVLHTLTQQAGFRGLLADNRIKGTLLSTEVGDLDGWMSVKSESNAFSDNDIKFLLDTVSEESQKAYAEAYHDALFDENGALRAEPDYDVLEMLKDRLASHLATRQEHDLLGGFICAELVKINTDADVDAVVEDLTKTWVDKRSWLADDAKSTALQNPNSVDGKILRAEIQRFVNENLDMARRLRTCRDANYAFKTKEKVYGNLMDAISRAERSIWAFRDLEHDLPSVVEKMATKYSLDAKRINTLQVLTKKMFETTLSDFTELVSKNNVTEDDIAAFMSPDGHSLCHELTQKIEAEAERLTKTDVEIATTLSSEIATELMGENGKSFVEELTRLVHRAFGEDVGTGDYLSENKETGKPFLFENMVTSIYEDLTKTISKSGTLLIDELKATASGNVKGSLDMMRAHAEQMRDVVQRGMYEAFRSTADELFKKLGPALSQNHDELRSSFMAKLSQMPEVKANLSDQACRFLSNPSDLDRFHDSETGFTASLKKVLARTMDQVIQNHGQIKSLVLKATDKVTAFLSENPSGGKIRMANDAPSRLVEQQRELREMMKRLVEDELASNLKNPDNYDFKTRGTEILKLLNEKVDAYQKANTQAYLANLQKEQEERERLEAEEKKFREESMKGAEEGTSIKKESTIQQKDVKDVQKKTEVDEMEGEKDIAPAKGSMTWEEMASDFMLKKDRLEHYIKELVDGHSSSEDEVSLFEWSHDLPMHPEFKMPLGGVLKRFMRNMLSGEETRIRLQQPKNLEEKSTKLFVAFDEEKMKTRMRESATQFWKAITEQVPRFVKTLGEELERRGVNMAALDLVGARKANNGGVLPPMNSFAEDIFALGKKYIVDILVQGLLKGESQPDFAQDIKILLGGEDGFLAELLVNDKKETERILNETFNDVTEDFGQDFGNANDVKPDELRKILQAYVDELRTTEPALGAREISYKVKAFAGQFYTFHEDLKREFDARLMKMGAALPPGRKDLDNALVSGMVSIQRAKTGAEKVKMFRELVAPQNVESTVSVIISGLEDILDLWRARNTDPNYQKEFLKDRQDTQWATGKFIGLLKPNAKTGVPTEKQIAEAEKAFNGQSELIRRSIAKELSSNVHMRYADLLSSNGTVTNERLEQIVLEEERAILPHIMNVSRVLASCEKVLRKQGVIGKNAPYALITDLLADHNNAYHAAIAHEVELMLRNPQGYKSNFSLFGDSTSKTFTDEVMAIRKKNA